MSRYFIAVLLCLLLASCRPETYTPKPQGYYKIELPKHAYQQFDDPRFPYTFMYPVYGRIVHDTSFFGKKPENPYWINVDFPSLGGTIYISYKEISATQTFSKLLEDAHKLSFFHTKKADYINEDNYHNNNGTGFVIFDVGGDAASAYQFIATDSTKHFIRGALYFDVSPNADSLKPVNDFLRKDITVMLSTLKWR
jgi:gliding motility-associated lipoprotein GldD